MSTRLFLFIALLISILWESEAVYGRGSLSTWPHAKHPDQAAQAEACTLDVVLVTFQDATTPAGGYDYHEHDLPYAQKFIHLHKKLCK